uniref:PH domain-containing protein n=1 Tax=Steinernema glaseri TaxID=37863 RepID=A0A1I8A0K0_9BILA
MVLGFHTSFRKANTTVGIPVQADGKYYVPSNNKSAEVWLGKRSVNSGKDMSYKKETSLTAVPGHAIKLSSHMRVSDTKQKFKNDGDQISTVQKIWMVETEERTFYMHAPEISSIAAERQWVRLLAFLL